MTCVCECLCVVGGILWGGSTSQTELDNDGIWVRFHNCVFFFLTDLVHSSWILWATSCFQLYFYSQRWKASEGSWARNEMQSLYDLMATRSRREGKQRTFSGSGPPKDPYCDLLFWFVGLCLHLHWPVLLPSVYSHSTNVMLSAWQEIKVEPPSLWSPGNKITIVNPSETNKQINKGGRVGCQHNTHKMKGDINACEQTLA